MRLIVLLAAALAGCAAPQPPTAQGVQSATTVQSTQFDARIAYQGPEVSASGYTWRLRAWRDKATSEVRAQLYVSFYQTGERWRNYRTASFEDAAQVSTVRIETDVQCRRSLCGYTETVGVPLVVGRLDPGRGLQVRLNSQAGVQTIVQVPAEYVRGFLEVVGQK